MPRLPLSAVLIVRNEEKKIARCLESLCWVNEIVVLDAHSTDHTRVIMEDPHAPWSSVIRIFERQWTGFRDQRNAALAKASHDWVLVVDADEVCTSALRDRLLALLSEPGGPPRKAYQIRRQEFFLEQRIFYGMWNPSYQDRFFYRAGVQYVNEVHEYPLFLEKPTRLEEPLLHLSEMTVERYLEKLNRYTTLEAKARYEQGQRTTLFRLVGAFPAHFLKSLFYYEAYRDGRYGVIISLLEGVSRVVRQIKLWQLSVLDQQKKEGKPQVREGLS